MNLDVVVPTYKRPQLLRRTLASLCAAPIPTGLNVTVIVVDNNSSDDTPRVVADFEPCPGLEIRYIRETSQGLSHARNAGIAAGSGEIVGFIDDDEEVDSTWYAVVAREFSDRSVDYIGGCYLGNWTAPPPAWLPPGYNAVIGVVPPKPRSEFGHGFPGNLMGGNAVIRRAVFGRVGVYSTKLGRSAKGLLSGEDSEFYARLRNAGIRGIYTPELAIYHHIPRERLTRTYYRRWVYWCAVSGGIRDRESKEEAVYLFGVPRYRFGRVLRSSFSYIPHRLTRETLGHSFQDELSFWELAGFVYGKYFAPINKYYGVGA